MSNSESKQILLVDDDMTLTEVLARAFTRRGFRVVCAHNHAQALAAVHEVAPDYAVVDLKIGNESGLQLIQAFTSRCPQMRILIYTGYSSIATTVEAMRLGAFNYLCKPASTEEIISALNNKHANPDIEIAPQPHSVERLEWEHIQRVLSENDNNVSATARALGMHRRTLQRKLNKHPVRR